MQIIIIQRLVKLHEKDAANIRFIKYTRQYFLNVYDELHIKNEFSSQFIDFYLEREISYQVQHKKVFKINLNENSNMSMSDNELKLKLENEKKKIDFDEDEQQNDAQHDDRILINDETDSNLKSINDNTV